jgi:hypothetical protein
MGKSKAHKKEKSTKIIFISSKKSVSSNWVFTRNEIALFSKKEQKSTWEFDTE